MDLIDLINDNKIKAFIGVDDISDTLNYCYSVVLIMILGMVITVKTYVFKPLACYFSNAPGSNTPELELFDAYAHSFCWVHGTIPLKSTETTLENKEWDTADAYRRITYYQWVPFMLGLQCVLFYLPRVLWQLICSYRLGTDLEEFIKTTQEASKNESVEDYDAAVDKISSEFANLLFHNRDIRSGRVAKMRRKLNYMFSAFTLSKQLGAFLAPMYLLLKVLYATNAFGQLFLIKKFLGYGHTSLIEFNDLLIQNLYRGIDIQWSNSTYQDSSIFPLVSYCNVRVRQLGTTNRYIGQCALPINMLNDKVYTFLWFWTSFVAVITLMSIPLWLLRLSFSKFRSSFVKKFLRQSDLYQENEREHHQKFIDEYLRPDGVFLLRMMSINAGDLITCQVINKLWIIYRDKYLGRDFRDDRKRSVYV